MQQEWIVSNPVEKTPYHRIRHRRGSATTITAAGAADLMANIEQYEKGVMVPYFAICLFAGIRPCTRFGEISKLQAASVRLDTGVIHIEPEVSKVRMKRNVTIQPNLATWLRAYPLDRYPILPTNAEELRGKLFRKYQQPSNTLGEARKKIDFLKHAIEHGDGYKFFYVDGKVVEREKDLQLVFKLVWEGSFSSVDSEVNNGRGSVDFKISRGAKDSTLMEFKLASNSQLEKNLENQVAIYEKANKITQSFKVILFFTKEEEEKVLAILKLLKMEPGTGIILIDARRDNKPSASKATGESS